MQRSIVSASAGICILVGIVFAGKARRSDSFRLNGKRYLPAALFIASFISGRAWNARSRLPWSSEKFMPPTIFVNLNFLNALQE